MLEQFLTGLQLMLQWQNILFALGGVTIGIMVGAIPGLTVTMAIAIMVPITFKMSAIPAIAMLLGIYKGGMYGGSIAAILVNTPGTPAASATVLDGYPMAQKGQAVKALKISKYASVMADTLTDMVLIFVAPPLAAVALEFGPAEVFSLVLFALTIIAAVSGESLLKGLVVAALGLLFATVGMDPVTGLSRFSFGYVDMLKGVGLIPMLIGLFAISEILVKVEKSVADKLNAASFRQSDRPEDNRVSWKEFKGCLKTIFRGAALGTGLGAIPGLGSTITAFLNYGMAKRASKHPERFGHGELEGVAAAEAGNSAVVGATLIPLLSMGIPGDIVTAVLLGAFMIQGIAPGPTMFTDNIDVIYALFIGMMICNVGNFVIGTYFIKTAKNVLRIPNAILYPVILMLCFIGTYAVDNSLFDVQAMFFFGILGYIMRKFGYPLAPLLIAFVLGPMLENAVRQALIISDGSITIFFTRPISLGFLLISAATVIIITIKLIRRQSDINKTKKNLSSAIDAH
jgi:putative tricarboxylic transport membrane protein